jgi:helix-turn-helix, Psq domain
MQPQHQYLSDRIAVFYGLFLVYSMTSYTEDDVRNALVDVENGTVVATAAIRHGIPRTTLRHRLRGTQTAREAHKDQQRLSAIQEEQLEQWILRQEALTPTITNSYSRYYITKMRQRRQKAVRQQATIS